VGRLIVSITLPSEVRAEKKTYEYEEPEESCAEWVAESCLEEGRTPEECEYAIYSECPMVKKTETRYVAVIEGEGLITKEGVLPVKAFSKLTYVWWIEGEEPHKPVVESITFTPRPELDEPFRVALTCSWEKRLRYYDLTLVILAVLRGPTSEASGEGRATTRVKFPRR
jgi:hypothetical protein